MKKLILVLAVSILAGVIGSVFGQNRFWVAASASNWNNTANWSTTSGGPGGASVPGATEVAVFNANGLGTCNLDIAPTVAGMTVNGYTGTINFQGNNLTTTGTNQFATGTLVPGTTASLILNTTATTTFSGTTVSVNVSGTTGRLLFHGSTFNGAVDITKTDNNGDFSNGNNVFNGTTTLTNTGDGFILMGNINRDQFNGVTTFNNNGGYRIYLAYNHGGQTTTFANDVFLNTNKSGGTDAWSYLICEGTNTAISFGGNVTINNAGTVQSNQRILQGSGSSATYAGTLTIDATNTNASTSINMGANGTSVFNGNIVVNNPGGINGIYFNNGSSASSTLAATRTVTIGGSGFVAGTLSLARFTQLGSTAQTLTTFSGTATLAVGPNSDFSGAVNFVAPQILLNGAVFQSTAAIEKTGATQDFSSGGNTFQSTATITNSGPGEFILGNGNADTFNGTTTFNNTGSFRIRAAYNHSGQTTTFNGNVTLNSNKSGGTDQWSFLFGELNDSNLAFNGSLTINCAGTLRSDHRFLNGTGSVGTYGSLTINLTNTNPSTIITMGVNGTSTYTQNIIISNPGGTNGVSFNSGSSASSTLAAGQTISIGAGGFIAGSLSLPRFTQTGATNQSITLTGSSLLTVGPASQFDGNVNFVSPRIFLNGCTYGGTGSFEKTGASDDGSAGGNIFTGVTTITNNGSGAIQLGNTNRDQFLSDVTFINTGSYRFQFANNHNGQTTTFAGNLTLNSNKSGGTDNWSFFGAEGANTSYTVAGTFTLNCQGILQSNCRFVNGNGSSAVYSGPVAVNVTNTNTNTSVEMGATGTSTYNANIVVTNTGGAAGVWFNSNASASSTLSGAISSGGFSSGQLNLYRFTQTGAVPQSLTLTNSGTLLRVGPASSFDGNVTFVSPRVLLNGATYNGTASIEKNGSIDDFSQGGNTFNGTTTLTNSGSGFLLMANNSPDIFNGDLTVTNAGSNLIYLAHASAGNQFNGNIVLNNSGSATGIRFSNNALGSSTFNAGATNTISIGGSGFSTGDLRLLRFTQTGTSAQALTLTGSTTQLVIGPGSEFNGNVTFSSPRVFLNGALYNGTASIEKTAANNDDGQGGNTFNQTTTLTNSGSSYLLTGSTNPDIFNGLLVLQNNSSSTIRLADNSAGNQFNGNIELNSTSGGGIFFGNSTNGTSTLAAGRTVAVGSSGFITGDVRLIRFTQVGPTNQSLNLGGIAVLTLGPSSSFGGNVDFRSPQLFLNGTTFNGTAYLEKKGAGDNYSNGGNTFVGSTTLVDSGSGYLAMALSAPDIFQSDLTATNTGSNVIFLANNVAGNQFNGNITFNSTLGSGGIYIGNSATGSATLGTGASLLTGASGFSSGELRLRRLTQIGSAAQTLTLTGTALLRVGPATTFNGSVDFRSPQIALDGATYNGITYLEKTGASNNDSSGGNSFLGATTTIANSGTGFFRFAIFSLDTFGSGDLVIINSGTSTIRMSDLASGTVFNGNIFVNSTAGGGVYFGESGGTSSIAAGKSIAVGGTGFTTGDLRVRRFTQSDPATPQTLLLTGTSVLYVGPSSAFSGAVNFRSPQIALEGATYSGVTYLEKTGANNNNSNGGNAFLGSTTTIVNSGSGFFRFASVLPDTFGPGDLILTNSGTSHIRMADIIAGTVFNGNILVNSTSGAGVYFGESGGTSSIVAGKSISVGGTGFTAGDLRLRRFTQSDAATPQTILLTGTCALYVGPSSAFSGAVDFRSPQIALEGATYNNVSYFEKTGAGNNNSNGGNSFLGSTTTVVNSGSGFFRFASVLPDTFGPGDLILTNSGTSHIRMSDIIAGTVFNGNIFVNSTSGGGIYFGDSGGTSTLVAGRTISVGGTGFTTGDLRIRRFTQTGTTAQNIALTGAGVLIIGPTSTWNGNFTASAPVVSLDATVFNGTTNSITKTGTSTDSSPGGNTFASGTTTTFVNSGTGVFRLGNATADDFAGNVIFNQTSGTIQPAYNTASTFRGNITVNSSTAINFGAAGGGSITFTGTSNQSVSKTGSASPTFNRLIMNKASGTVTLNTDARVGTTATFTSGILNTTTANYLDFADNATVTGASNASFVDGPVRKTGNDAFTFPIGDNTFYRPAAISAPTNTAHFFTAQYFNADHGLGSNGDPSFISITKCEYWQIDRNSGASSNVLVTLSWQEAACVAGYITDPPTVRVTRWNGTSWVNLGNGGTTGTATNGTIVTSAAVTAFNSQFTLASSSLANPLPVELTWFSASVTNSGTGLLEWRTASELNNDRFEVQRSENGIDFTTLGSVDGAGTTNKENDYRFEDTAPILSLVYYRLKQIDFNGEFEYSNIVSLDFGDAEVNRGKLLVGPNPVSSGSYASFGSAERPVRQTVKIFNSMNQIVREYSDAEGFNTEGLAAGIYIVRNQAGEIFRLVIK